MSSTADRMFCHFTLDILDHLPMMQLGSSFARSGSGWCCCCIVTGLLTHYSVL